MKKRFIVIAVTLLFLPYPAKSEDAIPLWNNINGRWLVSAETKQISDESKKTWEFGYSELINNRSIISCERYSNITSIRTNILPTETSDGSMLMLFFSSSSYRSFYAFRFTGDKNSFTALQFIKSEIIDSSKPASKKNNFKITVLSEKKANYPYDKPLNLSININNKKAQIILNGKQELSFEAEEKLTDGFFGISHKFNAISASSFKVLSGKKTIFEDDFTTDKVRRPKAVMTTTSDEKK
jgi:hypothetical protein